MKALPYLTHELPGIDGDIRQRLEDFHVEELPLYPASGQGTHVYFRVTKRGVPTPVAVRRIARHMGVHPSAIGFAGLKDAKAATSQWMSLEFADEAQLARFRDSQVQIAEITRHGNKLRPGHLAGNRFGICIRGVGEAQLAAAQSVLGVLVHRGVPNFFGPQRFGARGDTAALGAALLRNDAEEFIRVYLGRAAPDDPPECKAARDAFDAGFLDRAFQSWPRHYTDQRRAVTAYKRKGASAAVAAVDKRMKRLFVSAFQSEVFNEVLARRLDGIDRVLVGDWAQKTDTGGVFQVEDAAVEQPRAEAFEISPTGPIIGSRCNLAGGSPGEIEREAIDACGIAMEGVARVGSLKVKGSRRALRFALIDPQLSAGEDEHGPFIDVSFTSPSGCYATVVLGEIMKSPPAAEGEVVDG
ncbi:MAG TPA: tRNA pseudouridine(13) synthase TruD [Phycisphaerae bacterium]|nr:tRNA pseudouridine(13) synthase TruD [Phycisphaerae bacterium]